MSNSMHAKNTASSYDSPAFDAEPHAKHPTSPHPSAVSATGTMHSGDGLDAAARHSNAARNAHDTGVSDSGRWSTRRIAIYALFVALAMATSFIEFPIIPGLPWLKYDPSGIVCLIAGFAFGPSAALIVSVLGFVPHLLMDPWGTLMAVLVAAALSVPAALVYKYHRSQRGAIAGLIIGSLCAMAAAILGNLVVTPIYASMTIAQVAALIIPALLPFNLLKFTIHDVVTFLMYKPVSNLLHR